MDCLRVEKNQGGLLRTTYLCYSLLTSYAQVVCKTDIISTSSWNRKRPLPFFASTFSNPVNIYTGSTDITSWYPFTTSDIQCEILFRSTNHYERRSNRDTTHEQYCLWCGCRQLWPTCNSSCRQRHSRVSKTWRPEISPGGW